MDSDLVLPDPDDHIEVMRKKIEEWINEHVIEPTSLDMLMVAKQMTYEKISEVYNVPVSWIRVEARWVKDHVRVDAVIFKPDERVWLDFDFS